MVDDLCCECGSTNKVKRFKHRNLCDRCIYWYDMESIDDDIPDLEEFEEECL